MEGGKVIMITHAGYKALKVAFDKTIHYQATVSDDGLHHSPAEMIWKMVSERIGVELGRYIHEKGLAEIKTIPWSQEHRPDITYIKGSAVVFKPEEFEKFLYDLEMNMMREFKKQFSFHGPNFNFFRAEDNK
jgi:hypothetical protein